MTNLSRMESPRRDGRNKSDGDDNGRRTAQSRMNIRFNCITVAPSYFRSMIRSDRSTQFTN
ncbi:hypothetical protein F511_28791 [Dorcoceras hygrometricum]|uniref:Uncharacterized protein n=1 Tax=Dorcoceras hygrometricum TaxID=472368 RepID=A0A2Z7BAQ3_9LAMI|nr:hypothetical protein F511_28791 [Dorcoceras hygrometricum]